MVEQSKRGRAAKGAARARQAAKKTGATARTTARADAGKPAGVRAARKTALRARIVAAALELFETRGFQATTTKAIAQKARIAEGTIFNYFPTKEDIALHFFEEEVDHAIAAVRNSPRLRKASLEEKLFALVQHQIEYLTPYERFIGEAFVQALRPSSGFVTSPRSWQLRERYLDYVYELIQESRPAQRQTLTGWLAPQAFWVLYIAMLLYWLNDPTPGKQSTWAVLDRSLRIGVALLDQEQESVRGAPRRRATKRNRR